MTIITEKEIYLSKDKRQGLAFSIRHRKTFWDLRRQHRYAH